MARKNQIKASSGKDSKKPTMKGQKPILAKSGKGKAGC